MNKKGLITTIVCLAILAVVAVSCIVMVIVKVNANTVIAAPSEIYITCKATDDDNYDEGRHALHIRNTATSKEKIDKIVALFNGGFEQTFIKSLFSGELGQTVESSYVHQVSGVQNTISKSYDADNQFTVFFYYETPRTITVGTRTFIYQYLFFNVNSNAGRTLVTFGLNTSEKVDVSSDNIESIKSSIEYEFNYKAHANFDSLYNYLRELIPA